MDDRQRYLLSKDAAAYLGLKTATLRAWRAKRIGPPYLRVSKTVVVYPLAELRAWADDRERHATRKTP